MSKNGIADELPHGFQLLFVQLFGRVQKRAKFRPGRAFLFTNTKGGERRITYQDLFPRNFAKDRAQLVRFTRLRHDAERGVGEEILKEYRFPLFSRLDKALVYFIEHDLMLHLIPLR